MTATHAKVEEYALALSQAQEKLVLARDALQEVAEDERLPDVVRDHARAGMRACVDGARAATLWRDGLRRG